MAPRGALAARRILAMVVAIKAAFTAETSSYIVADAALDLFQFRITVLPYYRQLGMAP
jgi:hypothetical protein